MNKTKDIITGQYKGIYTDKKLKFVKDNYMTFSDRELALKLKVSLNTITHWRVNRLGLMKMKGMRNLFYKDRVKFELTALKKLNYSGIMQDSVNKRIEFLENKLAES